MKFLKVQKSLLCNYLSEDVLVGKSMNDKSQIKELNEITNDDFILDIGPRTNKIKDIIENSKTVLWNGPAGYFEIQTLQTVTKSRKQLLKNKNNQFFLLLEVEILSLL